MSNSESYNKICEAWYQYRKSTPVNTPIVEFSKLIPPHGRILDIGCGTGVPIAKYLSEQGFFVTGIDPAHQMILKAQALQLKNAEFVETDFLSYTTDIPFDGIIAFDSFWHIDLQKQPEIYQHCSSMMAKDAYLLFTHGNRTSEITGTMFEETFYYSALDTDTVKTLLHQANLTCITCIEGYQEETTGDRDLFIIAKKNTPSSKMISFPAQRQD